MPRGGHPVRVAPRSRPQAGRTGPERVRDEHTGAGDGRLGDPPAAVADGRQGAVDLLVRRGAGPDRPGRSGAAQVCG